MIIGSSDLKLTGGLTNFVSWKFIDLNFTLTYSLGGHAYDAATWLQPNGGTNYVGNVPAYYKIEDTWEAFNRATTLNRPICLWQKNTWFLHVG